MCTHCTIPSCGQEDAIRTKILAGMSDETARRKVLELPTIPSLEDTITTIRAALRGGTDTEKLKASAVSVSAIDPIDGDDSDDVGVDAVFRRRGAPRRPSSSSSASAAPPSSRPSGTCLLYTSPSPRDS